VDYELSYLPGQRLSRCTCPNMNQSHPGPMHSDGTYVGRSAPEIDVFEAQVFDLFRVWNAVLKWRPSQIQYGIAGVSQSAQWAVRFIQAHDDASNPKIWPAFQFRI
jgi:hypothetical protein